VKHIARTLEADRKLPLETVYVDCKAPQGSLTGAKQAIEGWMADARARQPCLLVLDNLEKILPGEVEVSLQSGRQALADGLLASG
jgi:peroxin-1